MTDEQAEMLSEVHGYLFKPTIKGKPSRAEQLDDALIVIRTGRLSFRALLWLLGTVAFFITFWDKFKGWLS